MGTSTSVPQLIGKLERFGSNVVGDNDDNVKRVVGILSAGAKARAAEIAGGDLTFRNNRGRKIGVREEVLSGGVQAAMKATATGPMRWVEDGVRPHDIVPGAKRGASRGLLGSNLRGAEGPVLPASSLFSKGNWAASTRGAGVVLKFADGTYSRYARNAGTLKGNGAWSGAVNAAERVQGQIHMQGILRAGHKAGF